MQKDRLVRRFAACQTKADAVLALLFAMFVATLSVQPGQAREVFRGTALIIGNADDEQIGELENPFSDARLGETACRYHHEDAPEVEVGFISSVSQPFCRDCNRARLSADGQIFTCLFAAQGHDIKSLLR